MSDMTDDPNSCQSQGIPEASKRFALSLFAGVFASRALTSTSAYFGDSPIHVAAAQNHIYVIQVQGYWLFLPYRRPVH